MRMLVTLPFLLAACGAATPAGYLYAADDVVGNDLLSLLSIGLNDTDGHIYLTPNAATKRAMRET